MRITILSVAALLAAACPAAANGQMKQSPQLFHKAGAACTHGHRGPQVGAGYGYRLGGCLPNGR